MPFLAALAPAIAGGAASAGAGALINSAIGSGGQKGSGYQAPAMGVTSSGGVINDNPSGALTADQRAQIDEIKAHPPAGFASGDKFAYDMQQAFQKQNLAQSSAPRLVMPTSGQQATDAAGQVNSGINQQQGFVNALNGANGVANQSSVFNQLQGVVNGQGPNPAQAMLANATGANTANQAALMAGQRGAGANAGLITRQAAQQGATNQQTAAGQGAALQANQSLGALNQLGGIAGQQVGEQQGALNAYNQAAQSNQQTILNALQGQNQILSGQQGQQTEADSKLAGINAQGQNAATQGLIGGATSGLGTAITSAMTPAKAAAPSATLMPNAGGGLSPGGMANGGMAGYAKGGPVSKIGQHFMMAKGGKVPALVSPGEKIIPRKDVKAVAEGKKAPIEAGKTVPGKPKVGGAKNSYDNDTVPKTLNEGDIVLPRSVTQAKNPHWAAHAFVKKILENKNLTKKGS